MTPKILQQLLIKIRKKKASIAIIGLGYVGLPTAALFANSGYVVTAVDVKSSIVECINGGRSPIDEPGLHELISSNVKAGNLKANLSSDISFENQDIIIISVQTPVDKKNQPVFSFLNDAIDTIGRSLKKGALVIISSTVPPGTIQEKIKPKLESLSSLESENDFFLAYVPERIAPGKAIKEFAEGHRLVGGIGPNSTKIASELFRIVCKSVVETHATAAEISKLAENTFRDVNIAFANQLALICEQKKVDIKEVINLANTHPRVNIHKPGPGVGGPCLTKDPYLLMYGIDSTTKNLIKTAREINDYMPTHLVNLVQDAMEQTQRKIRQSTISILGTAYKADVDDGRFSPSEKIIKKLLKLNAKVIAYDPLCKDTFGAKKGVSLFQTVRGSDCLVVLTDHSEFKNINLEKIKELMAHNPAIIDGKRIIKPNEANKLGFIYYGVGYAKP